MKSRKRIIAFVAVGVAVLATAVLHWPVPDPPLIISPETTYITAPLDAEGLPDYVAYMNQETGRGVTGENNAALLMLQALGPSMLLPEKRAGIYKALGMEPLSGDANLYFQGYYDFLPVVLPSPPKQAGQPLVDGQIVYGYRREANKPAPTTREVVSRHGDFAATRPWEANELPFVGQWLARNQASLDLLVEASHKTRYHLPMISDPGTRFVGAAAFSVGTLQDAGKALAARAWLAVGAGDSAAASRDAVALVRLGLMIHEGSMTVEQVLGQLIAVEGRQIILEMARRNMLSAGEIRNLQDRLWPEDIAPPAVFPTLGERFFMLDAALMTARGKGSQTQVKQPVSNRGVDWNTILRKMNYWANRGEAALALPTYARRQAALNQVEQEVSASLKTSKSWLFKKGILVALGRPARDALTEMIGRSTMAMVWCSFFSYNDYPAVDLTKSNLARLGLALATYRADHGAYPSDLAELSPAYLKQIPEDVFIDKPLHYQTREGGYLLYSVGPNMTDDGGVKDDRKKKDDLTISVP